MNFPTPPSNHDFSPQQLQQQIQRQPTPVHQTIAISTNTSSSSQPSLAQQQHQQHQQLAQHQQHQQHQNQQQHHHHLAMNGMNGAGMAAAAAAAGLPLPTPAGHQAELNYIYGMVEELSRQLADNRRVTEDIVSGLGRVRNRARSRGMANDDVIGSASDDITAQQENIDALISQLSESLEKTQFSRDANASLLSQYATALAVMLKQLHEYKLRHVGDVAAWHRSYRAQLDEARRENSSLREQIWEMQAHAGLANESLRGFRQLYDDDEAHWRRRVDDRAARQELRFWKRMAMPELEDDDPYWSDDDDIIDPAEKERLRDLERKAAQEQMNDSQADDSDDQQSLAAMGMMGGIAMQREDPAGAPPEHHIMPMPPPRPLSAASSTGSSGQQSMAPAPGAQE